MALLMTQTAFAERRGVGKSAVSNWKRDGLLVFGADPEKPGKQLVDVEKTEILLRGSIDPTRGRPRAGEAAALSTESSPSGPRAQAQLTELEQARLDQLRERTRRDRIETERSLGTLVPLSEFERRASEFGRRCREGVQAFHRQLAERLAAEADPRQVMALLNEAADSLFTRLADDVEAEASAELAVDRELAPLAEDDEEEAA